MATTTPVSRSVGFHRPQQTGRWALAAAALLIAGMGLGLILDSGRETVPVASEAAEQVLAPGERSVIGTLPRDGRAGQTAVNPNEMASILAELDARAAIATAPAVVGFSPEARAAIEDARVHGGYYDMRTGNWVFGSQPQPAPMPERGDFTAAIGGDPIPEGYVIAGGQRPR